MRYEGNIFRPSKEADSFLLQCTIGCSHNRCIFCGMFKNKKYRVRRLDEIKTDIRLAKEYFGDLRRIFLCDADAITIRTDILLEIVRELYSSFPSLEHVASYIGPRSALDKKVSALRELNDAGIPEVYLGVETGDDKLLREIKKGVDLQEMLEAGQKVVNSGIKLTAMIILGLGGRGTHSRGHALATAKICNEMKPQSLAVLTLTPVPHTILYGRVQAGDFRILDAYETLAEMKLMLEAITINDLYFYSTHASNYLGMKGILQKDKQTMLKTLDYVLESGNTEWLRPEYMRGF